MLRSAGPVLGLVLAGLLTTASGATAWHSPQWQTCSLMEGKGNQCGPGERPRVFREYLVPGEWTNSIQHFSGDFHFDIAEPPRFAVSWREIGRWGSHRIRRVTYSHGGSPFADLILVEGSPNIFSPLMLWSGRMPETVLQKVDTAMVLVLQKDFGANIPMVSTWAWVWGAGGPVRLNTEGAMREAIQKVAPGFEGYSTSLDFRTLYCRTWVWKGEYPGKVAVSATVEAWFELGVDRLLLRRAIFSEDGADKTRKTIRWPSTARSKVPETPGVLLKQSTELSEKGPSLLLDPGALESLAERVLRAGPLQERYGYAAYSRHRRQALESVASSVGVRPAQLNAAILGWTRTVATTIQQGLAALYRDRPDQAASHLRQAVLRSTSEPDERARAAYLLGRTLYAQRHFVESAELLEQAAIVWPFDTAILNALGWALDGMGDFAGAELTFQRALLAEEAFSGPDSERVARQLRYVAYELYFRQEFREIEACYRRALSIIERTQGSNSADYAELLQDQAVLASAESQFPVAEKLFRRALEIRKKALGPEHPETTESIAEVGKQRYRQHSCDESEALFQEVLAVRIRVLGNRHPATADALNSLALCREQRGDVKLAEQYYRRALSIRENAVGENDSETAAYMSNLAKVLVEPQQREEAERLLRRSLEIQQGIFGQDHPNVVGDLYNLGLFYSSRGRLQESEQLIKQALALKEKASGPDHADIGFYLTNLAALLINQGKNSEAEPMLRRALVIQEQTVGPNHFEVAQTLANLAIALARQGKFEASAPLFERALKIYKATFGPRHRDTLQTDERLREVQSQLIK